jgi:hypothetical protein
MAAQRRCLNKALHDVVDTSIACRRRVSSRRRLHYTAAIGCHCVDGTFLTYGPNRNLPLLLRWLSDLDAPGARAAN